jgi:16S rRNA (guanine966-N2)-methyltransferase
VRHPLSPLSLATAMTKPTKSRSESDLRIIAGRFKGRRIRFSADGVRPTGDRVRETVFNWLAGQIAGARCLDLFAGTGALGIEALSRGADSVFFVEENRTAVAELKRNLAELGCSGGTVVRGDAFARVFARSGPFDVVFLDPPFDSPRIPHLCKLVESVGCLSADALVYIEVAKKSDLPDIPAGWQILHENTAGQVRYALVQRAVASAEE